MFTKYGWSIGSHEGTLYQPHSPGSRLPLLMSSMSCCKDLMYSMAPLRVVTFVLFAPDAISSSALIELLAAWKTNFQIEFHRKRNKSFLIFCHFFLSLLMPLFVKLLPFSASLFFSLLTVNSKYMFHIKLLDSNLAPLVGSKEQSHWQ